MQSQDVHLRSLCDVSRFSRHDQFIYICVGLQKFPEPARYCSRDKRNDMLYCTNEPPTHCIVVSLSGMFEGSHCIDNTNKLINGNQTILFIHVPCNDFELYKSLLLLRPFFGKTPTRTPVVHSASFKSTQLPPFTTIYCSEPSNLYSFMLCILSVNLSNQNKQGEGT